MTNFGSSTFTLILSYREQVYARYLFGKPSCLVSKCRRLTPSTNHKLQMQHKNPACTAQIYRNIAKRSLHKLCRHRKKKKSQISPRSPNFLARSISASFCPPICHFCVQFCVTVIPPSRLTTPSRVTSLLSAQLSFFLPSPCTSSASLPRLDAGGMAPSTSLRLMLSTRARALLRDEYVADLRPVDGLLVAYG